MTVVLLLTVTDTLACGMYRWGSGSHHHDVLEGCFPMVREELIHHTERHLQVRSQGPSTFVLTRALRRLQRSQLRESPMGDITLGISKAYGKIPWMTSLLEFPKDCETVKRRSILSSARGQASPALGQTACCNGRGTPRLRLQAVAPSTLQLQQPW